MSWRKRISHASSWAGRRMTTVSRHLYSCGTGAALVARTLHPIGGVHVNRNSHGTSMGMGIAFGLLMGRGVGMGITSWKWEWHSIELSSVVQHVYQNKHILSVQNNDMSECTVLSRTAEAIQGSSVGLQSLCYFLRYWVCPKTLSERSERYTRIRCRVKTISIKNSEKVDILAATRSMNTCV